MRANAGGSRLDRDVRELLRDDPELLALAETIASLRPREVVSAEARRRWRARSSPRGLRRGSPCPLRIRLRPNSQETRASRLHRALGFRFLPCSSL